MASWKLKVEGMVHTLVVQSPTPQSRFSTAQISSAQRSSLPSFQPPIGHTVSTDQKIVILLATFNGADHLVEQLESFSNQSHKNWELVVSDDGSTDCTIDIVRQFAMDVQQRVTIVEGPQQGFWKNFLSLLRHQESDGDADLFALSDQDDVWFSDKLRRAADWFATQPKDGPALYFSRTELVGEDGASLGYSPLFKRKPIFQNALVQSIGGGNTMVLNRAAKLLVARTPADVALVSHDWWSYQVITGAGGKAFYDPEPSLSYRQHGRNLVGSNKGLRQRLIRLTAFANRRVKIWNDINLCALDEMRYLLSEKAMLTLDRFSSARSATFPRNVYLLWRSGVYRQQALETLGMYLGSLLGLI